MGRIWIALGLAAALAAGVGVIVASSGDDPDATATAAPADCLKDWNRDDVAREAGRHNLTFHRYEEAQVGYLDASEVVADAGAGDCVVVFPSGELDPEPEFAAFLLTGGRWQPLTGTLPETGVGALQASALSSANATLTADGELEPQ